MNYSNTRIASFYFIYFAVIGCVVPYWGVYLDSLHFSSVEIGYLIGIYTCTKIVAPYLWGVIADKTGWRIQIIRIGLLAGIVNFALLVQGSSFFWVSIFTFTYSFFLNAVLPQFEVVTLNKLKAAPEKYSHVRLWGSVGFVCVVFAVGVMLDSFSVALLPWVILFLLGCLMINALWIPLEQKTRAVTHTVLGTHAVLSMSAVLVFICFFCVQFSHGPYYAFFSIILKEKAHSATLISIFWAVGVVAEIGMFLWLPKLLKDFSLKVIIVYGLFISGLRWLLMPFVLDDLVLLFLLQFLHAVSFGVMHAAAIEWVRRHFPDASSGVGQAIYSGVCFGLGAALGNIYSGYMMEYLNYSTMFMGAGVVCMMGAMLAVCVEKRGFHDESALQK